MAVKPHAEKSAQRNLNFFKSRKEIEFIETETKIVIYLVLHYTKNLIRILICNLI